MEVGGGLVFDAKKAGRLSWTMALVSTFETPGTCFATKEKWKCASIKNKHLIRCASWLSLHTQEVTTRSTAPLSQQQRTVQPLQWEPLISAANKIDRELKEGFLRTEMQFHLARNVCHHTISALLDSFKQA